ncbi:MAG: hypothetical protein RDV48_17065 [Candidatus Eremiobacteraeota bacterium]|nr:hypothetical protein [Candidatus Eremiobacteraeota bacterium]
MSRNLLIITALLTLACPAFRGDAIAMEKSSFSIAEGHNRNYFLVSDEALCHLVLTDRSNPRVLVNFPAGNSGIALWFSREEHEGPEISLVEGLEPATDKKGGTAASFSVSFGRGKAVLSDWVLDSVRQVRNYGDPQSEDFNSKKERYGEDHAVPPHWIKPEVLIINSRDGTVLSIERKTLDNGSYHLLLKFAGPVTVKELPSGKISMERADGSPLACKVTASVPFAPLAPFKRQSLFSPGLLAFRERLAGTEGAAMKSFDESLRNLLFLSSREKYCAGSWRFLTYFGRDTILSLLLMREALTAEAFSLGMESILDRLSDEGSVAHEEDIGSWAEFRYIEEALSRPSREAPVKREAYYDYKMIDDDFLFPLMAKAWLLDGSISLEVKRAFLEEKNARGEKNIVSMARNWDYVLGKALPLSGGKADYRNLIRTGRGEEVGDWRDSREGLGGGVYPGSVNIEMVAQCISSVDALAGSGLYPPSDLQAMARSRKCSSLAEFLSWEPRRRKQLVEAWHEAKSHFIVSLEAGEMRRRLRSYMDGALERAERAVLMRQPLGEGITLQDFLDKGSVPASLAKGIEFYALSLDEKGNAVPVMNSDFSFWLFLGEPDPGEIRSMLRILRLPYPVGLRSEAGIFVANPAYSPDKAHWVTLGRKAYHGTVVWSWQLSMLEMGLSVQIERYRNFKRNERLVEEMLPVLRDIRALREKAGALASSELWSYRVKGLSLVPSPYGAEEGSQDESNAVQLWSTVLPAVMMKEASVLGLGK